MIFVVIKRTLNGKQYLIGSGKWKELTAANALLHASLGLCGVASDADEAEWSALLAVHGTPTPLP